MSKEANKFLTIQACVLKVNICCGGCQKKVRRVLLKTEGVYKVTIDEEEKKVTVTGTVDPATLIRKLNKAGKHAELWPAKGKSQQNLTNMLQELKLDHAKGQQKGGGGGTKEQKSQKQAQELGKGFKDLKFPNLKDLKFPFKKDDNRKVKFNLPSKEEMDDGSDYSDDDEDGEEFDDEDLHDMHDEFGGDGTFGGRKMMNSNQKNFNQFNGKGHDAASHKKGGGGGGGGGGKGANLVQVINKAMGGKNGGHGKQNQASAGGKKGHGTNESKNGGGSNKNTKVGNQNKHGHPPSHRANEHVDGSSKRGFPAGGMPPGYFQPGTMPPEMSMMAGGNPYQQQQYLQALMLQQQQQQQQRMMMSGAERPAFSPAQMGYGYGRPVYVPQPYPQEFPYSMFSDENANSCSVM